VGSTLHDVELKAPTLALIELKKLYGKIRSGSKA
jgi:hypothetical protein